MRKLFFIAIAGVLAIAGCTREVPEIMNGTRTELTAGREAGPATRSELNEDGENLWSVGDKILVGWAGGKMAPFSSKETEPTETARFTGLLFTNNSGDDTLYGIYPAEDGNAVEKDGSYTLKFHAEQNAVAGSYDPEAFLAVAQTTDKNLAFYNVLGLLKFQVAESNVRKITLKPGATAVEPEPEDDPEVDPEEDEEDDPMITPPEHIEEGEGEEEEEDPEEPEVIEEPADPGFIPGGILTVEGKTPEIKEYTEELDAVVLKGPGGKNFAPETDYYLAVPPCVLENGVTFELLYSDGTKGIVSLEGSKEVERSKIHDVGVLEGNAEPEPEGPDTNGVEYVEMAPGFYVATCNVGANSPEEAGDYFAWGETEPKTEGYADWDNYKWVDHDIDSWEGINKYTIADYCYYYSWYEYDEEYGDYVFKGDDGDGVEHWGLASYDYEDDAARKIMGGDWHMPSDSEWEFLVNEDYFTWEWTAPEYDEEAGDVISLGGYTVTSKVEGCEGNSIFLPATSCLYSEGLYNFDCGYYWLSSSSYSYSCYPHYAYISESYAGYYNSTYPYYGFTVRGVCGECPPVPPYSLSIQWAGYFHNTGRGYTIAFAESVDSMEDDDFDEDTYVYTSGKWFQIDVPEEIMNKEVDLTDHLSGASWNFYMESDSFGTYYSGSSNFRSGSLKVMLDEETGTIEFEIDAVTCDGIKIQISYSGEIEPEKYCVKIKERWPAPCRSRGRKGHGICLLPNRM